MTKQKKFKRRVRARMKETGERYTEAAAEMEGDAGASPHADSGHARIDAALAEIRTTADPADAARVVASFRRSGKATTDTTASLVAEYHHHHIGPKVGGAWLLATEVLEIVWAPHAGAMREDEIARRVAEVLARWRDGGPPEGGHIFRSPVLPERARPPTMYGQMYGEADLPRTATADTAPEWDGGVVDFSVPEPTAQREASIEGVELEDVWEHAPDVRRVFFGGERPLDEATAHDLARQFRRLADQAEAMGERPGIRSPFDFRLVPGYDDSPGRKKTAAPRAPLKTDKIKIGERELDDVHGGEADELIRYAQEIERLRLKLSMSGIDPDEGDEPAQVTIVVRSDDAETIGAHRLRRILADVRSRWWPAHEVGFLDAVTSTRFICWRETDDGAPDPAHYPDGPETVEQLVRGLLGEMDASERLTWLTLQHRTGARHCLAHMSPEIDLLRLPMRMSVREESPLLPVDHLVVRPEAGT